MRLRQGQVSTDVRGRFSFTHNNHLKSLMHKQSLQGTPSVRSGPFPAFSGARGFRFPSRKFAMGISERLIK